MSSRNAVPLLAAWLGLVVASPVTAQSLPQPRTLTVTPFIHTSFGMGAPAPDDSLGLGVAVGYDWTANLGFEGEISHLFDVAGDTPDVDWSVSTFMANALYHFDTRYVTSYATFGIGLERSSEGLKDSDSLALLQDFSATEIAINFGGGVKYALRDRWTARADLRRFQANDIAPDYWRIYGGLSFRLRR